MLYSFLLMTNDLFAIYPEEDLLAAILENSKSLHQVNDEGDELSTLLSDLLVNRRIMASRRNSFDD